MPATTKIDVLLRLIEVHLSCDLFVLTEKCCRVISSLNRNPFLLIKNDIYTSWNQLIIHTIFQGQEFTRIHIFSDVNSCKIFALFLWVGNLQGITPPQMKLGMLIIVNSLPISKKRARNLQGFTHFLKILVNHEKSILRNFATKLWQRSILHMHSHLPHKSHRDITVKCGNMEIYCHTFLAKILWKQRFY